MIALWAHVKRDVGRYLAVATYLTLPTGSYDNSRVFNLGENPFKSALQIDNQSAITSSVSWMGGFDTTWYGDNHDYGNTSATLEQKPFSATHFGFRYDINRQYFIAAQYFYSFSAESSVNGVKRIDESNLSRYLLSAYSNYGFGTVGIQYGQDIKIENRYKEYSRLILR